jgi:signal transduction histidine kinase
VITPATMKTPPEPVSSKETPAKAAGELSSAEAFVRLRTLAHDLSNSIETIMQASYLLGQGKLDETSRKWFGLVEQGVRETARVNREIRDILRAQTEKQK